MTMLTIKPGEPVKHPKLTEAQAEVLEACKAGKTVAYHPYAGRMNPTAYYCLEYGRKCTAAATGLIKLGFLKAIKQDWRSSVYGISDAGKAWSGEVKEETKKERLYLYELNVTASNQGLKHRIVIYPVRKTANSYMPEKMTGQESESKGFSTLYGKVTLDAVEKVMANGSWPESTGTCTRKFYFTDRAKAKEHLDFVTEKIKGILAAQKASIEKTLAAIETKKEEAS